MLACSATPLAHISSVVNITGLLYPVAYTQCLALLALSYYTQCLALLALSYLGLDLAFLYGTQGCRLTRKRKSASK